MGRGRSRTSYSLFFKFRSLLKLSGSLFANFSPFGLALLLRRTGNVVDSRAGFFLRRSLRPLARCLWNCWERRTFEERHFCTNVLMRGCHQRQRVPAIFDGCFSFWIWVRGGWGSSSSSSSSHGKHCGVESALSAGILGYRWINHGVRGGRKGRGERWRWLWILNGGNDFQGRGKCRGVCSCCNWVAGVSSHL